MYGGTKGEMERLLADASKISGIKYDISSYADVTEAIHVIQDSMGITGTTALEAAETVSGSLNAMKGSWKNLMTEFGKKDSNMDEMMGKLITTFETYVGNIMPIIDNLTKALPQAFEAILPAIGSMLPSLLKTVVDLFKQVLDAVLKVLPSLIPVVVEALLTIVDAIIDNLSLIIDAAFILLVALADGIIKALPEMVPRIVQVVVKIVETIIQNLPMIIAVALQVIIALAAGLIKAIPQLVKAVPELVGAIVNGFKSKLNEVKGIGTNIFKGVWEGISASSSWLIKKVKDWCGSILNGIKAFFGIKSPSRVMAAVGENIGQGLAIGVESTQRRVAQAAKTIGNVLINEEEKIQKQLAKMDSDAIIKRETESEANHKDALAKKYAELAKTNKAGKQKVLDEIAKIQTDREKELAEASDKNLQASLNNQLKIVQNFKKEYEKAVEDIGKSQDNMANKLMSFGALFERTQNKLGRDIFKLTDLQGEISAINNYADALSRLKEKGVSDSLLSEITNMSVEDATAYTKELLKKTDTEYEKYMLLWDEKQALATAVAKEFYKGELDNLKAEFVDKIPEELAAVKDEMKDIGVNAGQGLANGFASQKEFIKNTFVGVLKESLAAAKKSMEIRSPSRKWAEVGTFMAMGLGQGFTSQMQDVTRQIANSIPSNANMNNQNQAIARMGEGVVNGLAGILPQANGQPIIIQLVADGKTLAQTIFDPLTGVARQKGVQFG